MLLELTLSFHSVEIMAFYDVILIKGDFANRL